MHLRVSFFHAPLFFSFNYLMFLTAGNTPLPLEQEQLCHRDHGRFKVHVVTTLMSHFYHKLCHCTSGLVISAFCVPFPAQGSPWEDVALHPVAGEQPWWHLSSGGNWWAIMFPHPTPAEPWLDCPLENAVSRWKFPLGENSPKCTYPADITGQKQEEESVYISKACLRTNLTSGLVIPVVLIAIAYHCQQDDSSGRPSTDWLSMVGA